MQDWEEFVQISSGLVFRLAKTNADCISADKCRLAYINADEFALVQVSANNRSILIILICPNS